jgi:hypothetical protein
MGTPLASSQHPAALALLQKQLDAAGWEIAYIDLDFTGDAPKAQLRLDRHDGRLLFARVDGHGRAILETFQRTRRLAMSPNAKGRRPLSPQVDDLFLGRTHCLGARHMLRVVSEYVSSNALTKVPSLDFRRAFSGVMGSPVVFNAP